LIAKTQNPFSTEKISWLKYWYLSVFLATVILFPSKLERHVNAFGSRLRKLAKPPKTQPEESLQSPVFSCGMASDSVV